MCNVPRLAALLIAFLLLACYGCAEKTPPAPSATSSANVQPVPPPELKVEDLPEFEIPGGRLQVPEWAGKRADEPFPVREYVEELLERQSDGERWYLAGLGRSHSEPAVCAVSRKEDLQASVKRLEELLMVLHPDAVIPSKFIPADAEASADGSPILDFAEQAVAEIDRAQQFQTCLFDTDLEMSQDKPHLRASMRFAQIMGLEIARSSHTHDCVRVEQAVRRSLRLSTDVRPAASYVGDFSGEHIERIVEQAVYSHFIHSTSWTAEEYKRIQTLFRDHHAIVEDPFRHTVRESYITLGCALWALQQKSAPAKFVGIDDASMSLVDFDLEWRALNELYSWVLSEYETIPYHTTIPHDEFESRIQKIKEKLPIRAQGSQLIKENVSLVNGKLSKPFIYVMLFPAVAVIREEFVRHETYRRMLDVALQIRRFEAIQHRSPATMAELYPGGEEPGPPVDPYSGQPLKYRIIDGVAVVYSVGKDQIDQGGTEPWDAERKSGDRMYKVSLRYP